MLNRDIVQQAFYDEMIKLAAWPGMSALMGKTQAQTQPKAQDVNKEFDALEADYKKEQATNREFDALEAQYRKETNPEADNWKQPSMSYKPTPNPNGDIWKAPSMSYKPEKNPLEQAGDRAMFADNSSKDSVKPKFNMQGNIANQQASANATKQIQKSVSNMEAGLNKINDMENIASKLPKLDKIKVPKDKPTDTGMASTGGSNSFGGGSKFLNQR